MGAPISDIQGWGAVITGANVPGGQPVFYTQGAGGATTSNVKTFHGPVYVADPTRLDFQAKLVIEDGDLWYSQGSFVDVPAIPEMDSGYLVFDPDFLRGPACPEEPWNELFTPPTRNVPTSQALSAPLPFDDVIFPGCRVFYPGKYTTAPALTDNNYFVSGDYYFENVAFELNHQAIFGFPSGSGDAAKVNLPACRGRR